MIAQYRIGWIRKALQILIPEGEIFELRIIGRTKNGFKQTYSGYFSSYDQITDETFRGIYLDESNVYFTLNKINEQCYYRMQRDRMRKIINDVTEPTTSDDNIIQYRLMLIDLDPNRVKGVSSTDAELCAAKNMSLKIKEFMCSRGFSAPIEACSGNGIHLLYRINLEYDHSKNQENKLLLKKCLKVIDLLFSDESVKVDTSVFNPARITKLYGTRAHKGVDVPERPHRISRILEVPSEITVNPIELLQKLSCEIDGV